MEKILITSCKGGVGKSTVAANLACALGMRSRHVLLVDFDLGNRSLDLILGYEDKIIYDITDVAYDKIEPKDAVIVDERCPNVAFVAAPFRYENNMTSDLLSHALEKLDEEFAFDFAIVDTSGGADMSVTMSAPVCDSALIISSQNPTSIRAAEKSGMLLDEAGVPVQKLIINSFDLYGKFAKERAGILEMIDKTRTSLIGIVPADAYLARAQEDGELIFEIKKSESRIAFENIAARICGEHIPLLSGFARRKRGRFMF